MLTISSMGGERTHPQRASAQMLVGHLRHRVAQALGKKIHMIRLVAGRRELEGDGATLGHYGVDGPQQLTVFLQPDTDGNQAQYLINGLRETESKAGGLSSLAAQAQQAQARRGCSSSGVRDFLLADRKARQHALRTAMMQRAWAMRETPCRPCPRHSGSPREDCAECLRVYREMETNASIRRAYGALVEAPCPPCW